MLNSNEILRSYGTDYKEMTKRLLEKAELASEIKEGACVGIKPNLLAETPAQFGATTHPEIVAGIIEYLQAHGISNIVIAEGSWVGAKTADAFEYCGFNALAAEYGIKIIDGQLDTSHECTVDDLTLNICDCVDNIDFLINVPVLKGHCQTLITCALKNMKGLIPNAEKRRFHKLGLHKPIAYLNKAIRQDFIVVDHICGDPDFEEGGNPLVRNCVMVAKDPVLVDALTASIIGYDPMEVEYLKIASEIGIGSADLENAEITTVEGESTEGLPDRHKIFDVKYAVEDVESCSGCYAMLMEALTRLKDEGLFEKIDEKISIGQGRRPKPGKIGIGNCNWDAEFNIHGCPPQADFIYEELKRYIKEKEQKK